MSFFFPSVFRFAQDLLRKISFLHLAFHPHGVLRDPPRFARTVDPSYDASLIMRLHVPGPMRDAIFSGSHAGTLRPDCFDCQARSRSKESLLGSALPKLALPSCEHLRFRSKFLSLLGIGIPQPKSNLSTLRSMPAARFKATRLFFAAIGNSCLFHFSRFFSQSIVQFFFPQEAQDRQSHRLVIPVRPAMKMLLFQLQNSRFYSYISPPCNRSQYNSRCYPSHHLSRPMISSLCRAAKVLPALPFSPTVLPARLLRLFS